MIEGSPVQIELMIDEAYSWLGFTETALPIRYSSAWACQCAICSRQRRGYSSSGMPNFSMRSGLLFLMNHGVYSAKCSELSVTKYPILLSISYRTRLGQRGLPQFGLGRRPSS